MSENGPTICSLDEATVHIEDKVCDYLTSQFSGMYKHDEESKAHMSRIMQAMKRASSVTVCRVNQILATRDEVIRGLQTEVLTWQGRQADNQEGATVLVRPHAVLSDVVCIEVTDVMNTKSLSSCRVPPVPSSAEGSIFKSWPQRAARGWPMTHRVVICDRFCGEAVLRGSDIFVRGVICADMGIHVGEKVAVYTDVRHTSQSPISRGLLLQKYNGRCIFLGMGFARCTRTEMFTQSSGVAVEMSCHPSERAGPVLPPLSGVMTGKLMMQNLPSIVVAHALDPRQGDVIIDLCSAPGGKTSHVASLVQNNATIVACDKSRRKMTSARACFQEMGISCITPLALDSTACVVRDGSEPKSVKEILSHAPVSEKDGLLNVKKFYAESFDRVLLDPPCSALGLRPKLQIAATTLDDLQKHVNYQRQFVREAVALLKHGGTMTYSTCTINAAENEGMVYHILDEYKGMQLIDVNIDVGLPGLPDIGLTERERHLVRRFDPSDDGDTIGFFVAKFIKRGPC